MLVPDQERELVDCKKEDPALAGFSRRAERLSNQLRLPKETCSGPIKNIKSQ